MTRDKTREARCPGCGNYRRETLPDSGTFPCPRCGPFTTETADHVVGGA